MVKVAVTNRTLQIAVIVVYGSWWLSNSVSIWSHPVFVANQKTQLKIETMHWFSTLDSQSPNTKSVLLNWCYHISVESNWYSVFRPNADVYIRNTKVLTMIYWPTYTNFFLQWSLKCGYQTCNKHNKYMSLSVFHFTVWNNNSALKR